MTSKPTQEDQVRQWIRNLQPKYVDHIKFQPIESFTKLYDKACLLIKEEVQTLKNKGFNNNNSFKKSNTVPSNSKSNDVNALATEK